MRKLLPLIFVSVMWSAPLLASTDTLVLSSEEAEALIAPLGEEALAAGRCPYPSKRVCDFLCRVSPRLGWCQAQPAPLEPDQGL